MPNRRKRVSRKDLDEVDIFAAEWCGPRDETVDAPPPSAQDIARDRALRDFRIDAPLTTDEAKGWNQALALYHDIYPGLTVADLEPYEIRLLRRSGMLGFELWIMNGPLQWQRSRDRFIGPESRRVPGLLWSVSDTADD